MIQRFAASDWCEAVRFSLIVVSIAVLSAISAISSIAHGQSLVVTETAPADGDVKVSPELGEIVVRSSASVDTSSYAFVISPDGEFPEVTADRYDDPNADVNLQLAKDFKLSQVRPRGPAR